MSIILCCPFHNENLIARINIEEASKWVDEIHILETNFTHQYSPKEFVFSNDHPKLHYHAVDVTKIFRPNRKWIPYLDFSRRYSKNWRYRNSAWYNESLQRNLVCKMADIQDDDIVVLSDIDEIIDSRCAARLIDEVKKRGMITIRLHFTMFYFNLFSKNWGGPADYSYRTFITTGNVLRENWRFDSDRLRKEGENEKLNNRVYCLPFFAGFHHSWLGDEKAISRKLTANAHTEHRLYNDLEYIRNCIRLNRSIFPDHELAVDNSINLLPSVEALRPMFPNLFI